MNMLKIGLLATLMLTSPLAQAGTVENMERERALLIDTFLDPTLPPAERGQKIEVAGRRLIDLERMVLRDDSLKGRSTPTVRRVFANYDLSFLVHAATEKNMSALDLWLDQLGVSTQALMSARMGRR